MEHGFQRWVPGIAAAVLLGLFAWQIGRVANTWSATWDEPHHLYDGYTLWTHGDHRLNPEVPPLVKLVAAAPLLGRGLSAPPNSGRPEPEEAFRDGRAFVFDNGPARTLMPARYACALFALALAALTCGAAWRRFGAVGGVVALLLVSFDPTVLANGPLVTTDIASALFIFAACLAFTRAGRAPRWPWVCAAGLAAGAAMSAKFTGVLLAPILLMLCGWELLAARRTAGVGRRLLDWAVTMAIAWGVIWAVYGFRYAAAPGAATLTPPLDAYLKTLPSPADARLLGLLARIHLLPEGYLWGLANTKLTEAADTAYLFGHVYRQGPWWYFAAAFAIKSTLPLLVLLGVALFARLDRRVGAAGLGALLVPPVAYFAMVSASHFDIGVRHLLPVYPFLFVLAGGAAAALARRGTLGRGAVVLLAAWQVVTCLRAWPAYMAYGNEAWGGPARVHRYLSDANVDWGQQLKAVKTYLDARHENGPGRCWFAYFPDGAIEPGDYGMECSRLPTTDTLWWLKLPMRVPPVISGAVLVSDADLEGIEFGDGELNPYEGFRRLRPDAVIQGGVDVYHGRFAVPLASALVQVAEAARLQAAGDRKGALGAAISAAALAPRSALAQVTLAEALQAMGEPRQARARFLAARDLVRTVRPDLQAADLDPRIEAGLRATR